LRSATFFHPHTLTQDIEGRESRSIVFNRIEAISDGDDTNQEWTKSFIRTRLISPRVRFHCSQVELEVPRSQAQTFEKEDDTCYHTKRRTWQDKSKRQSNSNKRWKETALFSLKAKLTEAVGVRRSSGLFSSPAALRPFRSCGSRSEFCLTPAQGPPQQLPSPPLEPPLLSALHPPPPGDDDNEDNDDSSSNNDGGNNNENGSGNNNDDDDVSLSW
jgi:hypothetical protein